MAHESGPWERAFHFVSNDDQRYWATLRLGDPLPEKDTQVLAYDTFQDLEALGDGKRVAVKQILAPVPAQNESIICLGGNYKAHTVEANVPDPSHPACMWLKSRYALSHPGSIIPVPGHAYENFLDYEGELVIITSKDARDVSVEEAHEYILGFTCGNDLTAREWHDPARSCGQLGYAKGFDQFSPIGPTIVSYNAWKKAPVQQLRTFINGQQVQDAALDTMTFDPETIVSFLSQGHTIAGGSAIMTGTPLGVGYFNKPPYSLKDGDEVLIEIPIIGKLINLIRYLPKL